MTGAEAEVGFGRAAWVKCQSETETLLLEDSAHYG